jgi:hypothetical protein
MSVIDVVWSTPNIGGLATISVSGQVAHRLGQSSTPPVAPVVGSSPAMRDGDGPNDIGHFQIEDGVGKSICEKLAKPARARAEAKCPGASEFF